MNSVSFSNTKASQPAQTVTHLNSSSETKWRPPRKDALRFPKVGSRDSDRLNPYSSVQQAEFLVGERLRDGRNHKRPVKTPTKRQRVSLRDETPVDNGHEPRSRTKTRDLEAREEGRFSERRKTLHDFLTNLWCPRSTVTAVTGNRARIPVTEFVEESGPLTTNARWSCTRMGQKPSAWKSLGASASATSSRASRGFLTLDPAPLAWTYWRATPQSSQ